jgi:hypothetical protein
VETGGYSNLDVTLVQLTKKKKSRTFHTSSGSSTVENKMGFRKSDIRQTSIANYPEGIFSVTPDTDLKAGEYLLVVGTAANSFDFGIDLTR